MTLNPRILFIVTAVSLIVYSIQKNSNTDESTEKEVVSSDSENTVSPITVKTSRRLLIESIIAINFPDKELERCVLNEIKEGADSKDINNINALTKLQCNAFKITSLEGIENLSGLKEVTIIGSDIQDATPLSRINSITNIYLDGGNFDIQNIDSLAQLSNLKKINFPVMMQTYCYEAQTVIKSMKENIDGKTSNNLNLKHCRGKKNYKVLAALRKEGNGEPLSTAESDALDDYEANLSWSGEDN